jgi:hypothetical protein
MRAKVVGEGRLTGVVRKNVFPLSNSLLCKDLMSNDLMPDQGTLGALGATRTNPSLRELLSSLAKLAKPVAFCRRGVRFLILTASITPNGRLANRPARFRTERSGSRTS